MTQAKKMPWRKIFLWLITIDFTVFTLWAMSQVGYFGIWAAGFTDPGSMQLLFDLVIACFLITVWIKNDAKNWGINPYPWIAATFATGSIAILYYLLVREYRKDSVNNGAYQVAS